MHKRKRAKFHGNVRYPGAVSVAKEEENQKGELHINFQKLDVVIGAASACPSVMVVLGATPTVHCPGGPRQSSKHARGPDGGRSGLESKRTGC